MTADTPILLLPYAVAVLVKLASIVLERRIVLGTLEDLDSLPKPASAVGLDADQRNVIAARIINSNLKTTILITFVTSFVSAVVAVFEARGLPWAPWILLLFLVAGCVMLVWVLPRKAYYFSEKGWFGLERSSWALFLSCMYDVALAALACYGASAY